MAEYITKKQVIEWFSCYGHDDKQIRFEDLSFDIQNMNPEDVAPVVHGRWIHTTIEDDDWGSTFHSWACSNCDFSTGQNQNGTNYCPNCGARMDLEEPNEAK